MCEVRVRLLLLSSEFHLDGINSTSEEMDGGDLARRVVGPSDVDSRTSCPSALVSTAVVVGGGGVEISITVLHVKFWCGCGGWNWQSDGRIVLKVDDGFW